MSPKGSISTQALQLLNLLQNGSTPTQNATPAALCNAILVMRLHQVMHGAAHVMPLPQVMPKRSVCTLLDACRSSFCMRFRQ
jgi:hypothetical protein